MTSTENAKAFKVPSFPAGQSPLLMELYSEHKLNIDAQNALAAKLSIVLAQRTDSHVLIIGGKCGMTAELLKPFCARIDIVEEEPYLEILKERFINNRDIEYRFCREGEIGEDHVLDKPDTSKCEFNVFEMSSFDKDTKESQHSYTAILLQNVLINDKMNILEELLRIDHEILITMINPGKLLHRNLFELLAGIEKNILQVFYEHELHERLQNAKYITGRRQEILFWEIFVWRKKPAGEEGSQKILKEIKELLDKEIAANIVEKKNLATGSQSYETKELVDMYMDFHYNDEEFFAVKNFPKFCGEKALEVAKAEKLPEGGRALDIGCATGRTSLVLAEGFKEVIGIDLSHAFIEAANSQLQQAQYKQLSDRVKFLVGDACKLEKQLGKFSLIFGGNLIDRLYDPEAFLVQATEFLEDSGVLILTSPYTWLEEWTPKEKWIGGYYEEGKGEGEGKRAVSTPYGLERTLSKYGLKELRLPEDVRFVIKENNWVFQYTMANVTFWKKVGK